METLQLMSYLVGGVTTDEPNTSNAPITTDVHNSGYKISDFTGYGANNLDNRYDMTAFHYKSTNQLPVNMSATYSGHLATRDSVTSHHCISNQNGCNNVPQTSPDMREPITSRTLSPSIDNLTASPNPSVEEISNPSSPESMISDNSDVYNMGKSIAKDGASKAVKPKNSYIGLIIEAILSKPDKRMILGEIYQYIQDNFEQYNNGERGWRNSVRYNLSLNGCFVKSGRANIGKGNYWSIHPECIEDFSKGDYSRRSIRHRTKRGEKGLKSHQSKSPSFSHQYHPKPAGSNRPPKANSKQMSPISHMPPQSQFQESSRSYIYQPPVTTAFGSQFNITNSLKTTYSSQPRVNISYEPQITLERSTDLYRAPFDNLYSNSGFHSNLADVSYSVNSQGYTCL
ncbi:unnamed protein product [Owenia fusiformis]|uniref:Uncharacterized protein n=1 Tax=Owenia fusiformis TaxID=6347 RepID=A0A8J1UVX6_OWEFU|nr:unnamed protein product [Owenia fusiformis]